MALVCLIYLSFYKVSYITESESEPSHERNFYLDEHDTEEFHKNLFVPAPASEFFHHDQQTLSPTESLAHPSVLHVPSLMSRLPEFLAAKRDKTLELDSGEPESKSDIYVMASSSFSSLSAAEDGT